MWLQVSRRYYKYLGGIYEYNYVSLLFDAVIL